MSPYPWARFWRILIILATLHETVLPLVAAAKLEALHKAQSHERPKGAFPWEPRKEETQKKLMNAINRFRAEICYRMKMEAGIDFGTYDKCHEFMKKACNPGPDGVMDGDKHEISSGQGYCTEYFHESEEKARKEVEEEEKAEAEKEEAEEKKKKEEEEKPAVKESKAEVSAPSPAAHSPAPATGSGGAASSTGSSAAVAPSPASGASPAPAPAPASVKKYTPGKSLGKPPKVDDGENWYYKSDGKHADRLHMDGEKKLPTQGYWGKLVAHEDMETATGDWQEEHNPQDYAKTMATICKDYPESKWCDHYKDKGFFAKNSAFPTSAIVPMALTVITAISSL
jgi:hypothetical protein